MFRRFSVTTSNPFSSFCERDPLREDIDTEPEKSLGMVQSVDPDTFFIVVLGEDRVLTEIFPETEEIFTSPRSVVREFTLIEPDTESREIASLCIFSPRIAPETDFSATD